MKLSSDIPSKITLPFAANGNRNVIPVPSQIGITAGAASFNDGFPPLTMTPVSAGGVPPSGKDFNGIFYTLSALLRWLAAGGRFPFDDTFATDPNVNGYPAGAVVLRSDGQGYWISTTDNNTSDPEGSSPAGWVPLSPTAVSTVALSSSSVTLTPQQYGLPVILLTGTLTANLTVTFPSIPGEWVVINRTTGAYTVTCKTASGTGVSTTPGVYNLLCDGTNVFSLDSGVTQALGDNSQKLATTAFIANTLSSSFSGLLATNGYIKINNSLIIQWGKDSFTVTNQGADYTVGTNVVTATGTLTYPIAFPNGVFSVLVTGNDQSVNLQTQEGYFYCLTRSKTSATIGYTQAFGAADTGETTAYDWIAIGY